MKKNYKKQTGRSMIETLGVIVIVGILTIGGIWGLNYLLNKNKANEIWNELKSRSMTLAMQKTGGMAYSLNEYNENVQGVRITLEETEDNADTFTMNVEGISQAVCKEMLKNKGAGCAGVERIDGENSYSQAYPLYLNADSICTTETLNLAFTYNADLSEKLLGACANNDECGEGDTCATGKCEEATCQNGGVECAENEFCNANEECEEKNCENNQIECDSLHECQNKACVCISEEPANCATFNDDSCTCTQCDENYTLIENKCCANKADCTAYDSSCSCTACGNDKTVNGGNCVCASITGCDTPNDTDCTCTTCNASYAKSSGGKKCCTKITNCTTYSDSTCACTACDDSTYTLKSDGSACTKQSSGKFACGTQGTHENLTTEDTNGDSVSVCPPNYRWATTSDLGLLLNKDFNSMKDRVTLFENDLNPDYDDCKEQRIWFKCCYFLDDVVRECVTCDSSLPTAWGMGPSGYFSYYDRESTNYSASYALCIKNDS